MKINGTTERTNFKGAYIITGTKAEINKATKSLRKANVRLKTNLIGCDPYGDNLPAYLLVTTGKDIEKYRTFSKTAEKLYEANALSDPPKLREKDFESYREFEMHSYMSEALNIIEVLAKKCNFSSPLHHLSARKTIEAIKDGTFDYAEGRIKK